MKTLTLALLLFCLTPVTGNAVMQKSSAVCKQAALTGAKKLLAFYRDNDETISIDNKVTPLSKMKNPANPRQVFEVLETWGYIYKARYRMRFIFAEGAECLLMGEEIIEFASL